MKEKVYLAGPLFTKYEIEARKKEHIKFKESFPEIETFAPIDAPFNGGNPSNITIYEADKMHMDESNIFIFDLNNMDEGTLVEVGIAVQRHQEDNKVEIYGFLWDLRMGRESGKGAFDKPYGVNGFLIGAIQKHGELVHTFEEVLELMKNKRK